MQQIKTRLTQLLGIHAPIICPPMANVSGAKLATEVTLGGGFGFIAAGYGDAAVLRKELKYSRKVLQIGSSFTLPIGVGYLAWKLEEPGCPALDMLDAALENNVQAIWLSFGRDIEGWIKHVRQSDKDRDRKTIIFVQVNTSREAEVAYKDWGADVLVAQGIESGGHGGSYAPPVLNLVSSILKVVPQDGPPVLAAGGLSNGSHVAAYLTLGASGAVLGTRFLLTPESVCAESQKAALLSASPSSTIRTKAFDHARNTLGWPDGIDGRGLRNKLVEEFEKGANIELLRAKLVEGIKQGDPDYMITWAGQGVGDITEIKAARTLVQEMVQEILQRLEATAQMITRAEARM